MRIAAKVSVPGSIMLMGEHAVLHHYPAVCASIDRRITITLTPREDDRIQIQSLFGPYETALAHLKIEPPYDFVLAGIQTFQENHALTGFELNIQSDFPAGLGLGSSTAVAVATLAAIAHAYGQPTDTAFLFPLALKAIRSVQGQASGADVAASLEGGCIQYCREPRMIIPLMNLPEGVLVFSGKKVPTRFAVEHVNSNPESLRTRCFLDIGRAVEAGAQAILNQDWNALAHAMNTNQKIMETLGLNTPALQEVMDQLCATPGILAAKISGAGLGDCVFGLGQLAHDPFEHHPIFRLLPVKLSAQGLMVEKLL